MEAVGLTSKGFMDVPKNENNVGWYKYGAKPGEQGNAVFAGHLDTYTTTNGVFGNIDKLKNGDDIFVLDNQDNPVQYKVSDVEIYNAHEAPLKEIFGPSDKARLNLITCAGNWDKRAHQYTKRRVVYSELVG